MPPSAVVVGGGVIGCAIALELGKAGAPVTLIERAAPGAEASGAAGGLLAALGESPQQDPFRQLALESWCLYPKVAAELRKMTAIDVELMTKGTLYPLEGTAEIVQARTRAGWPVAAEIGVEVVDQPELSRLEPQLSGAVRAALWVRGDHWLNNQRLVAAYAAAAALRGARLLAGEQPGTVRPLLPDRFLPSGSGHDAGGPAGPRARGAQAGR